MKKADAIRKFMSDTVAVSEDNCKTCRIVARKNNETVLTIKFNTTPTQEEIEYTVRKLVENEDFIPNFLVPAITRMVEARVVFKMKLS